MKTEEFKVSGSELIDKVKEIIKEGNARRIIIKNKEGKTTLEAPLTLGVVGGVALAAMTPLLVAIGAIAGLVADWSLVVEREDQKK